VLVDARNGLTEQSRRHAFLTTLLRVPHLVLAVNKMPGGLRRRGVERIAEEFLLVRDQAGDRRPDVHPISALHGDNVVQRSASTPWYDGRRCAASPGAPAHRVGPEPDRRQVPRAVT